MNLSTPPASEVAWWCLCLIPWAQSGYPRRITQACEVRARTWMHARELGMIRLQCEPWQIEVTLRSTPGFVASEIPP